MKVLFQYPTPFALPHDGQQVQIIRLRQALVDLGVEVDYLRWFDDRQTGDVLHYFGRISPDLLQLARTKGMRIVMAESFSAQASFSIARKWSQRLMIKFLRHTLKHRGGSIFTWQSYRLADASLAGTPDEARLMTHLFDAPPERVHVTASQDWPKAAAELKTIYEQLLRSV
jgi:hypothetical protein